jgi:hypothetical protein
VFGVGMDPNIVQASLKAIVCAANRALAGKTKDLQSQDIASGAAHVVKTGAPFMLRSFALGRNCLG